MLKCVSQILGKTIPTYLLDGLGHLYKRVYLWSISQQSNTEIEKVYDIINGGPRSRFMALNGVTYHNCLAISYDMGSVGLAKRLEKPLKRSVKPDEAQDLIDKFYETFSDYADWKLEIQKDYKTERCLRLPCGWYMWGDNENFRSVGNVPIQGAGSSIMRKAVALAQDEGLKVVATLHDALYILHRVNDIESIIKLDNTMKEALKFYLPEGEIRTDIFTFGEGMKDGGKRTLLDNNNKKIHTATHSFYLDKRSIKEYEKFQTYLNDTSNLI